MVSTDLASAIKSSVSVGTWLTLNTQTCLEHAFVKASGWQVPLTLVKLASHSTKSDSISFKNMIVLVETNLYR